ncbi:MAG: chromate transporter [Erysipelotrichales bacterium]|nr:chromate transporter [Erysipelotrichales bacterium]
MIYLELFLTFFRIGLFTIGGGYAMIPMIRQDVISQGWITEAQLLVYFAISESTPGPFAINIATFVGMEQAGVLGAITAVLGVVAPTVIIIMIISIFIDKFLKNQYFKFALTGIKAVVVGLIFAVAISISYQALFPEEAGNREIDWIILIIIIVNLILSRFKKIKQPVLLILISALLGIILYSLANWLT